VLKFYKRLGITSLADLEQAAREDRIKGAKELGGALRQRFSKASRSRTVAQVDSTCTARRSEPADNRLLIMGKGLFPYPLTTKTVHLCLDMQRIFAPGGPWATPWMERVLPVVTSIASRFLLGAD
jgi:hypothetical protein